MQLPTFEELYVVSDLHLGGTRRVPIFKQSKELGGLFEWAGARNASGGGTIGLVLNGDVIDTLAEDILGYVATPAEAERVLVDVDRTFPEVLKGLAKFVEAPRHRLVIVVGNHDLELAYPNAQEALIQRLAGDDEARRGRIQFVTNGAGYRCRVGGAGSGYSLALCVHGNEYDDWNAVSPDSMTRIVRASVLGVESARLRETPNAGTKLVKDVMNDIKAEWPFVDLLKPEMDSVFNVLLALDPTRLGALGGVLAAVSQAVTEGQLRTLRVLGESAEPAVTATAAKPPVWQPGKELDSFLGSAGASQLDLNAAWESTANGAPAEDLVPEGATLGFGRMILNSLNYVAQKLRGADKKEALRAALSDWGGGQETWALDGPCEVFDRLVKLEPRADVVIAGHTHLRRQKRFPGDGAEAQRVLYLNTGTWARLLRLTPESLQPDRFGVIWAALEKKSMDAIDALEDKTVLLNQPTVAVIRRSVDGTVVEGALCEARAGSEPAPVSKFVSVRSA
jgi:UDP-2,3-diacylglucosamine pyrophosphatase LpxH